MKPWLGPVWTMALLLAAALPDTVSAETPEQLDGAVDAAWQEADGLAFASEQAARGEWLEALATLERVLARHPKSRNAQLLQAIWLCRVDDRPGGTVALQKLKRKHYDRADWAEARRACGLAEEG
jgi:hypothetical protein